MRRVVRCGSWLPAVWPGDPCLQRKPPDELWCPMLWGSGGSGLCLHWTQEVRLDWRRHGGGRRGSQRKIQKEKMGPGCPEPKMPGWGSRKGCQLGTGLEEGLGRRARAGPAGRAPSLGFRSSFPQPRHPPSPIQGEGLQVFPAPGQPLPCTSCYLLVGSPVARLYSVLCSMALLRPLAAVVQGCSHFTDGRTRAAKRYVSHMHRSIKGDECLCPPQAALAPRPWAPFLQGLPLLNACEVGHRCPSPLPQ